MFYQDFKNTYGNDTGLKRQGFRRLRGAMNASGGDLNNYLQGRYGGGAFNSGGGQPTNIPASPSSGLVPSTAGFNPAAWFSNTGSRFNTRGMVGMLGDYYPHYQQMMEQYKGAANGVFSGMQDSPMWQKANDPGFINSLTADTISPELLNQNIARGKDGIAMQGSQIEQELRNMAAQSGQRPDSVLPGLAGAKYQTAFNAAQSENDLRNQAAVTNQQGRVSGANALQGFLQDSLGMSAQQIDTLKNFAGSEQAFLESMMTLIGGQQASGKGPGRPATGGKRPGKKNKKKGRMGQEVFQQY